MDIKDRVDIKRVDIKNEVNELNSLIKQGQLDPAFEKYYAEDVIMQENNNDETYGKDANREREKKMQEGMMQSGVKEVKAVLKNSSVEGNVSFSEWEKEMTFEDGKKVISTEVSRQVWNEDGKIIHERFYYNND